MDRSWKGLLWPQLGAAIDMLENAVLACPDELLAYLPRWVARAKSS